MSGWRAALKVELDGFALDVDVHGDAGVHAIIGENGSGKSTLLRALAGALDASGHFHLGTRELSGLPPEARGVGYVPQGLGLFEHMSVVDNVAFGLSVGRSALAKDARRARAREMLEALDIAPLAARKTSSLSGGEGQQVALARALLTEPDLLLLDEPLAALDAMARRRVRAFLAARLAAFSRPSILVTHDVRDVVALNATLTVLDDGKVVQRGTLTELRTAPATPFVEEFLDVGRAA